MTKTPKDVGRHRRHPGGAPNGPASRHGLVPWLLRTLAALALLLSPAVAWSIENMEYIGSLPENEGEISSFEDIQIYFDFSGIEEKYGSIEGWGIRATGNQGKMGAMLYKGLKEDSGKIAETYETYKCDSEKFHPSDNALHLSFPGVVIEDGQLYTLVINYVLNSSHAVYKDYGRANLYSNPLVLTFYGKVEEGGLQMTSHSLSVSEESIDDIEIQFNTDIEVLEGATASIMEGSEVIATSNQFAVEDGNSLRISFEHTPLYITHNYTLVVAENSICEKADANVSNKELTFNIAGASYKHFGTGRIKPTNGTTTLLDEICIEFNFPEGEEDKSYGFVNIDSGRTKWNLHIYEGPTADGEEIAVVAGEVKDDNTMLYFYPTCNFKPGTDYTLVIPEGEILAYEIGAAPPRYLKDYLNERVELHYRMPSPEDLPAWAPSLVNLKDNDKVAQLKWVIFDNPEYRFGRVDYTATKTSWDDNLFLYLVTEDGDELISSCIVTSANLREDMGVGLEEGLNGSYFLGVFDEDKQTLYEGNTYKVVWAENAYRINNAFIGQYVYNPEISVVLKGATPREDETEFVTIGLNIGDYASVSYRMVKGQESVLDVKPGNDWKLESLSLNGEDVTADVADNGLYTLPALVADATLDAVYAYAHEIAYDYDTAVGNLEAVPFRLASDGNAVVITGLQGGETIAVYTVGGMKVAALDAVPADMHRATLTLPVGQAYIILVDGVAVKYRH